MINRVVLTGRLTRDPEIRTTTTGKNVASFTVAVNRRIKGADGIEADFFRVSAWGQTADFLSNYVQKGRLVAVDGRLQQRKFTDSQGAAREAIEVVADNVSLLDRVREDNSGGGDSPRSQGKPAGADAPVEDEYDPFADE